MPRVSNFSRARNVGRQPEARSLRRLGSAGRRCYAPAVKYAMGLLFIVGVGLIIGGIITVIAAGSTDAVLEYRFSGTVGAVGGLVMVGTVLLLPLTRQKPPES